MTRPNIIRADTIDLQHDQQSPSAQKHSKNHVSNAVAPHQAAAYKHVTEERLAEQEQLSHSWNDDPDESNHDGNISYPRDEQAIQQNGGLSTEDTDRVDADSDEDLDEELMDKISSSPSIDDEEIDFEFVYALHTFVATVEGQANATKGDTMVLLDDSNSYWWLVRIVKDSSIGYLPAEHIETPTERLARLNKHRNIHLSQTMLGDNAEKTKNPLKKAIRRRNTKTVQFSAPTYVEASDYESSSEEESDEQTNFDGDSEKQEENDENVAVSDHNSVSLIEQSKQDSNGGVIDSNDQVVSYTREEDHITRDEKNLGGLHNNTDGETEEIPDTNLSKSRNGTVRNTDSFFKDETLETRKITLTPNLLRDDASGTPRSSDSSRGPSFDGIDKNPAIEKFKDDKKKKERKPGMLSGLFKRKDKKEKPRYSEDDASENEQNFIGNIANSSKDVIETSPVERKSSDTDVSQRDRRVSSRGKLQKVKSEGSIAKGRQPNAEDLVESTAQSLSSAGAHGVAVSATNKFSSNGNDDPTLVNYAQEDISPPHHNKAANNQTSSNLVFASTAQQNISTGTRNPRIDSRTKEDLKSQEDISRRYKNGGDSLSDSPVRISPSEAISPQDPPALAADGSSLDGFSSSSTSSSSSRSFVEITHTETPRTIMPTNFVHSKSSPSSRLQISNKDRQTNTETFSDVAPTLRSTQLSSSREMDAENSVNSKTSSPSLPAWSDASLRSYLERGSDVRDLLLIIHSQSNISPIGPKHPLAASMFGAERNAIEDLGHQLDDMLSEWMTKRHQV